MNVCLLLRLNRYGWVNRHFGCTLWAWIWAHRRARTRRYDRCRCCRRPRRRDSQQASTCSRRPTYWHYYYYYYCHVIRLVAMWPRLSESCAERLSFSPRWWASCVRAWPWWAASRCRSPKTTTTTTDWMLRRHRQYRRIARCRCLRHLARGSRLLDSIVLNRSRRYFSIKFIHMLIKTYSLEFWIRAFNYAHSKVLKNHGNHC